MLMSFFSLSTITDKAEARYMVMDEKYHFLDQEHYASEKSDQPFSSHSEKRKSRFFENVPSLTRVTTEVVS